METKTFPLSHTNPEKWAEQKVILEKIAAKSYKSMADFIDSLKSLYCASKNTPYSPTLKLFIENSLTKLPLERQSHLLEELFPFIASLALKLETMFPSGQIPFLPRQRSDIVKFTREQVAVLIAGCFYCVIAKPKSGYDMKEVNFGGFYTAYAGSAWEKLQFYLVYFDAIRTGGSDLSSVITISRIVYKDYKDLNTTFWSNSKKSLQPITIDPKGKIEDSEEALQVDFADPYIGGGVDETGDQEQILFVIYPELHVSYLTCEKMDSNEALVISGFERFGKYSGYGLGLKFAGVYADPLKGKRDQHNRIPRHVLGIDATPMGLFGKELDEKMLLRELNKAYIGFIGDKPMTENEALPVSTGKWGCGAFGGSPQVKFLLQWLAASQNDRRTIFYSFGDTAYKKVDEILKKLEGKAVGELFSSLAEYAANYSKKMRLFDYLLEH